MAAASAPLVVALAAFACVLSLGVVATCLAGGRSRDVKRRLETHVVRVSAEEAKQLERFNVLKAETYSAIPLLNAGLARFRPARTARIELLRAGVPLTALQYLLGRSILATVLKAGFLLIGWPYWAPVAGIIGLALPRLWLRLRARRRRKAFEAQLAEAIDLIVGALRAGRGFLQGLESVTAEMTGPIHSEFTRVLEQAHVGVNPIDALTEITERIDSYDLALFTSSISIHRKTGGNLAEVLENIAQTVRERRRIRAEVFALTTGPRVSSYVLCLIPLLLLVAFSLMNASYRQVMLGTETGHSLIGFATVWSLIGLFFSQKVAKVEY